MHQAGLKVVGEEFEQLKDLDGACLQISRAEEKKRKDSIPKNDASLANLNMVLEKVFRGRLHTLFALWEPFKAKILPTNGGGNSPVIVSLNFKCLRYANKTLSENDQYRPTGSIYRLQEQSQTGVPAKELWIPQIEGGLQVLVETFQGSVIISVT